jgi:hypothetical protein
VLDELEVPETFHEPTPKPKIGRPSLFTDELADMICDRLMDGRSLRQICTDADMPHRLTIIRWTGENEAFATKCARARAMQADLMDDMILDVANACTNDTALADRVKISAYQWRASKLAPKTYGDKLQHANAAGDGNAEITLKTYRWAEDPKPE